MRIVTLIVALALAGCGLAAGYQIANMNPDELTKLTDADICHPFTGTHSAALEAERRRRDLADCSQEHLYCHNMGLKTGTDAYVQCRLAASQVAAQQAAAQAAQQAGYAAMTKQGAAMMAPQQPAPLPPMQPLQFPSTTNTNCNTFGNTLNCRSTTQP